MQELSIFWLLFLMPLITWHSCPHPPCRRRTSAASTAYEREERGGGGSSRRDGVEESARSRREAGGGGAAAGRDRPVREAWPEHREPANRYLRYFDTRKLTVEPRYYLMLGGGGDFGGPPRHTVDLLNWSIYFYDSDHHHAFLSQTWNFYTLLEKFWRIPLYLTDNAIAMFYVKFRQIKGNGPKIPHIELNNIAIS